MPSIVITLPADDPDLRDELIEQLEPYAEISEPPHSFDPEAILLLLGHIADIVGIVGFLIFIKDRYGDQIKIGHLGQTSEWLKNVDRSKLLELFGASEEQE